jgi:RNA polymerase sigma factor (sigma-70 family)
MKTRRIRKGELEGLAPFVPTSTPLTPAEERDLALRARRGDGRARDELVRRHLPLVLAFSRKQARGTVPLDELVQEGNLGLLRAVEKFDPDAGTRFSTYALWWIRAYVWRYLKMARSAVRPRSGTVALADLSLDAPLDEDTDHTWLDRVEDDGPSPDARYADAERDARVRGKLNRVRRRVGELGWDIIHTRLQRDPPDTLEQIGRRWGVSRERVRQVELALKQFLRGQLRPVDDERRAA